MCKNHLHSQNVFTRKKESQKWFLLYIVVMAPLLSAKQKDRQSFEQQKHFFELVHIIYCKCHVLGIVLLLYNKKRFCWSEYK